MRYWFKAVLFMVLILALAKLGIRRGKTDAMGLAGFRKQSGLTGSQPTYDISPGLYFGYGLSSGKPNYLINGIPAQINPFFDDRGSVRSIETYANEWSSRGYEVNRYATDAIQFATAVNKGLKLFECVILVPDPGSKKTLVIPAKMNLNMAAGSPHYQVPLCPMSQPIFHLESSDLAGFSENVFLLSDASVASVSGYYREELARTGWQADPQIDKRFQDSNSRFAVFFKGADEFWMNVSKLKDSGKTLVYLLYNDKS
jgi:hypothetical protein